jgi:signal transduction histidine kinase
LLEDHQDQLDPDGRFMLGQVRESARQMGQLIDDLLTFSRFGRREMTMRRCDVAAMAREVFQELRDLHRDRRLSLTVQDMPPALGDPAMLREVLRNLVDNAVKFTGRREVGEIEVGTQSSAGGGADAKSERGARNAEDGSGSGHSAFRVPSSEIVFFVRDNGVGFDMRYRDKLFQVFQRLHKTEDFAGTGIGLALVARITHRHGGRVWAEGEADKGATFYFTLRRADSENAERGTRIAERDAGGNCSAPSSVPSSEFRIPSSEKERRQT